MNEEYKTFEELKEELGDKFEEYMYGANINLLNNWNELKYYFKKQTIELEKVREDISMDTYINRKMFLKEVLDKMQEMEQVK